MQVFDGGPYDKRYEQTFAPAIRIGGALPVRADKILGTNPIIEKIEGALRDATIAFADISENNANVFTELGYALALSVPLVMVCHRTARESLPFDIGHRPVIFYRTEAQGDFEELSREIQAATSAALLEATERDQAHRRLSASGPTEQTDALKRRIILEVLDGEMGDPDGLPAYRLKTALSKVGFSERLTSLAVLGLQRDGMILSHEASDHNDHSFFGYRLTDQGKDFVLSQYSEIKRAEEEDSFNSLMNATSALSDDVPF